MNKIKYDLYDSRSDAAVFMNKGSVIPNIR